jgi:hypothetical protein
VEPKQSDPTAKRCVLKTAVLTNCVLGVTSGEESHGDETALPREHSGYILRYKRKYSFREISALDCSQTIRCHVWSFGAVRLGFRRISAAGLQLSAVCVQQAAVLIQVTHVPTKWPCPEQNNACVTAWAVWVEQISRFVGSQSQYSLCPPPTVAFEFQS